MQLCCLKSIRIQSFSGPYFPAFGLNTERYELRIHSEYGKTRSRKILNADTFHALLQGLISWHPTSIVVYLSQCSIVGTFEICLSGNLVNKSEKTRNYAKICLLYWTSLSELGNFLSPWSLQNILDFLIISERIDTMWFSQFTWFQNVRQAV